MFRGAMYYLWRSIQQPWSIQVWQGHSSNWYCSVFFLQNRFLAAQIDLSRSLQVLQRWIFGKYLGRDLRELSTRQKPRADLAPSFLHSLTSFLLVKHGILFGIYI